MSFVGFTHGRVLFYIMIPIFIANKIFVFRQNVVFVIQGREDQTFSLQENKRNLKKTKSKNLFEEFELKPVLE